MAQLVGEVFPADKPVSRFLVSMAMGHNDIENAMWKAGEANESDRSDFTYWVLLVMGHFVEAADALQHWRRCSTEVRVFLDALPMDGKQHLKDVGGTLSRVGKNAVDHARIALAPPEPASLELFVRRDPPASPSPRSVSP